MKGKGILKDMIRFQNKDKIKQGQNIKTNEVRDKTRDKTKIRYKSYIYNKERENLSGCNNLRNNLDNHVSLFMCLI